MGIFKVTIKETFVRNSVAYVKAHDKDFVEGWSDNLPDSVFLEMEEESVTQQEVTDIEEVKRLPKNWPLAVEEEDDWDVKSD